MHFFVSRQKWPTLSVGLKHLADYNHERAIDFFSASSTVIFCLASKLIYIFGESAVFCDSACLAWADRLIDTGLQIQMPTHSRDVQVCVEIYNEENASVNWVIPAYPMRVHNFFKWNLSHPVWTNGIVVPSIEIEFDKSLSTLSLLVRKNMGRKSVYVKASVRCFVTSKTYQAFSFKLSISLYDEISLKRSKTSQEIFEVWKIKITWISVKELKLSKQYHF